MLSYTRLNCQKFLRKIQEKQPTTWPGDVSAAQLMHCHLELEISKAFRYANTNAEEWGSYCPWCHISRNCIHNRLLIATELLAYFAQRALQGFINTSFKGILRGLHYSCLHFTQNGTEMPHTSAMENHGALGHTVLPMHTHNCHLEAELTGITHQDTNSW